MEGDGALFPGGNEDDAKLFSTCSVSGPFAAHGRSRLARGGQEGSALQLHLPRNKSEQVSL